MNGVRGAIVGAGAIVMAIALSGCVGPIGGPPIDAVGQWGDPTGESAAFLSLADGGALSGSDGCNQLTGTWRLDEAGEIDFEDVGSTMMACEGVPTPLLGLDSARISDDTMTVFADDDAQIATLVRLSEAPATAPPTSAAGSPVGTWGSADTSQPNLVLNADGSFTIGDGCNSGSGRWETDDDDVIEFDEVLMTQIACEGIDTSLSRLDWGRVNGDTLTVYDDADTQVAALPRVS